MTITRHGGGMLSNSGIGSEGMTPEQQQQLSSALRFNSQILTDDQKNQALSNLGAASSAAVADALSPYTQSTNPSAGKNKFNPSLAQNGKYIFFGGTIETNANGVSFGLQNVVEGQSYTYWIPASSPISFDGTIRCYDSNGAFLGLHQYVSSLYIVAPIPPTGVSFTGGKVCKFTIPIGSKIGKVGLSATLITHSQADYDALIAGVQLEIGNAPTAFEAYNLGASRTIKEESLPAVYAKKSDLIDIVPRGAISRQTATTVCLDSTYIYIRTKWNATLDLVQQVQYGTTTAFNNNVVNPYSIKTIPANTSDENTIAAYATGTLIASHPDDAAPCNYNFTYIGANHGAAIVHQITASAHGKVVQDVGSRWTNGSLTYTLMRIVDANTLWFVSQNTGGAYWAFSNTSINGQTLTHSAGATNTANIAISADAVAQQLYPAIRSQSKSIRLDGRSVISAIGVYKCEFVDIVNTYEICNPAAVLAYVQSVTGSATQPAFDHSSIATDMRVVVTYRYGANGACSINSMYQTKSQLRMGYIGAVQALPLSYSGKSIFQYVPKLNPIVGALKTWNLSAVEDITSQVETLNFINSTWADANNPPDRMVQYVSTAGTKNHGFVLGYGLQRGFGQPLIRKNMALSQAGFLNASTRKMYPYLLNNSNYPSSMIPSDTVITVSAYRSLYNFDAVPNATTYTWYYDDDDIVVVFDIHQTVTALRLPLPSWMSGLNATVIDASASFKLLTPIVSDDGLVVSVTGGYGQASIKLGRVIGMPNVPTGTVINGLWGVASFGNLPIPSGYWPLDGTIIDAPLSPLHGLTTPDTRGRVLANAKASGGAAGTAVGSETVTIARANLPNTSITTTGNFTPTGTVSVSGTAVTDVQPTGTSYKYDGTAASPNTQYSGQTTSPSPSHSHSATFTGNSGAVSTTFNLNGGVSQTAVDNLQPTYYVTQLIKL